MATQSRTSGTGMTRKNGLGHTGALNVTDGQCASLNPMVRSEPLNPTLVISMERGRTVSTAASASPGLSLMTRMPLPPRACVLIRLMATRLPNPCTGAGGEL